MLGFAGIRAFPVLSLILICAKVQAWGESAPPEPGRLESALQVLNDSPWARQQTTTEVVGGIGSGVYGEKEIFSRFYVRILSALPVREAYQQIARLQGQEPADSWPLPTSRWDPRDFIVVGLAFRSNRPEAERDVWNHLRSQSTETLHTRAFLSTSSRSQVPLAAYLPPEDPALGALFVFPRRVNGTEILTPQDSSYSFELQLFDDLLVRVTFPLSQELWPLLGAPEEQEGGESEIAGEAVSEFQKGTAAGGSAPLARIVNRFPQESSRSLHGSLYEFHRNDNLDARNFFDPPGEPLPEFKRNQFGGSLSWEVNPRMKLFASYDGLRIRQGSTLLSLVPTPAMKQGDFSRLLELPEPIQLKDPLTGQPFPGNRIPEERIHPVARRLLPLLPDPNREDPVRNFLNNQPLVDEQDLIGGRADLGVGGASELQVEYRLIRGGGIRVHPLPAFGGKSLLREQEAGVSFTHTFSGGMVLNLRGQFERELRREVPSQERPPGLLSTLGIRGVEVKGPDDEGYPVFELEGYRSFGDEDLPESEVENRWEWGGGLTLARGEHRLQFWGEVSFTQLNDLRSSAPERGAFSFSGLFTGDAFADFLLGRAEQATRAVGSSRQDLRWHRWVLGWEDEWRLHSRWSLTAGLTFSSFAPYRSLHENISVFRPLQQQPSPSGTLVQPAGARTVVEPDRGLGPRLALAFRPLGDNRLVFRSFYNIFHNPIPPWVFENFMGRNFPAYFIEASKASLTSGGLDLSAPFLTQTATELAVRDIDPQAGGPYHQIFGLSLQEQVNNDWSLELEYRGRRSKHLTRVIPGNVPLPGPGAVQPRRPHPGFGPFRIVTSGGSSSQDLLRLGLTKRYSKGFSLDANFEWDRSFNDNFRENPSNPRNLRAEWARSEAPDKRLSLNFVAELPFGRGRFLDGLPWMDSLLGGWSLSGIMNWSGGRPFTLQLPGDANNDGLSGDRPDRLSSGELPSGERSIDRWFDTGAFAFPAPFSFGNAGRNILIGPGFYNWDLSLIRQFNVLNEQRLELRLAFFNAFNHPNFDLPGNVVGTRQLGVISRAERAREIEIALRYLF